MITDLIAVWKAMEEEAEDRMDRDTRKFQMSIFRIEQILKVAEI
jgi:hypothetical protein